jgi:tungstate transport system substrate-binding protein
MPWIKQFFAVVLLSVFGFVPAFASSDRILVQSTTSTQNSGLYDYLLPLFEADTGLNVDVVAVGTGQAIRNARNGDADVLLVHATASEQEFVAQGYAEVRYDLMYNDFVIIGPGSDPAGLAGAATLKAALAALATGRAPFVSRGDDSGTHKKELALWDLAGVSAGADQPWYRDAGTGMGATIRTAIEMDGYTLTDRATWIAYQDKRAHVILYEGDANLFNQYGIIALSPSKFPFINADGAKVFVDWMLSKKGQRLIAGYRLEGQQLFFPNASKQVAGGN